MATETGICNLALARAGCGAAIQSLTESSEEARYCRLFYSQLRDELLAAGPVWGFATKFVTLSDLGDPPTDWTYRYAYPADCLRILKITNPLGRQYPSVPYELGLKDGAAGKVVLTDQEDAEAKYIARVTNPTVFSPGFASALSWRLAAELAVPIKEDEDRADYAMKVYERVLAQAYATDANEHAEDTIQDLHTPDWISERS